MRKIPAAKAGNMDIPFQSDGTIVGWGWNYCGQATPPAGNNYIAVSAGGYHSLAIIKKPCLYVLAGDLNDDCKVNFFDFAIMAANWLIDCDLTPENPACTHK
jgi:hypothetical protein